MNSTIYRSPASRHPLKIVFPVLATLISATFLHAAAQADDPIQKQRAHPILTEKQAATLPGSTASWIDSFFHTLPVQNNVYRSVGGTQ
jgi:hypothetical protein